MPAQQSRQYNQFEHPISLKPTLRAGSASIISIPNEMPQNGRRLSEEKKTGSRFTLDDHMAIDRSPQPAFAPPAPPITNGIKVNLDYRPPIPVPVNGFMAIPAFVPRPTQHPQVNSTPLIHHPQTIVPPPIPIPSNSSTIIVIPAQIVHQPQLPPMPIPPLTPLVKVPTVPGKGITFVAKTTLAAQPQRAGS